MAMMLQNISCRFGVLIESTLLQHHQLGRQGLPRRALVGAATTHSSSSSFLSTQAAAASPSPPTTTSTTAAATTSGLAAAATTANTTDRLQRVVVLGCGWAGFQLALNIADAKAQLTVISPRNHFIFTPLLPSASVGTLECRCIQEPVRTILGSNGRYLQAKARTLDYERKRVVCESIDNAVFELEYDKLVIAVGVKTNTFGIDSVAIGAKTSDCIFFLKQLEHARAIRSNIIDSFEKASIPTISEPERRRLLSFLVVGGGPTSCEFAAELHGASFLCFLLVKESFNAGCEFYVFWQELRRLLSGVPCWIVHYCAQKNCLSSSSCFCLMFDRRLCEARRQATVQRSVAVRENHYCRSRSRSPWSL
jgi:Pyridine nucleotide-disulphide oxidoreductase